MAVIHISEAEAARNLHSWLDRVTPDLEIRIERGNDTIAILKSPVAVPPKKTLSEAIKIAKARNSQVLLDDQWSKDLEEVIRSHEHEVLINPWE